MPINANFDGTVSGGKISSIISLPGEEFSDFISVFASHELLGSNVNRFFPNKIGGYDLVITDSDKENVDIKIIPLN